MRRLVPALIVLLAACAPAASPAPETLDAATPRELAPMVPDDGPGLSEKPQCQRLDVLLIGDQMIIVTLPCRPFNPQTDLGYPLP